jgi:hypothetical protein
MELLYFWAVECCNVVGINSASRLPILTEVSCDFFKALSDKYWIVH